MPRKDVVGEAVTEEQGSCVSYMIYTSDHTQTHRASNVATCSLSTLLSCCISLSRLSRRSETMSLRLPSLLEDRYVSPRTSPAATMNRNVSASELAPFCTALRS